MITDIESSPGFLGYFNYVFKTIFTSKTFQFIVMLSATFIVQEKQSGSDLKVNT